MNVSRVRPDRQLLPAGQSMILRFTLDHSIKLLLSTCFPLDNLVQGFTLIKDIFPPSSSSSLLFLLLLLLIMLSFAP